MFKKIATMIGLRKTPKTTLLLKNPKKGAQALMATKGMKVAAKNPVATAIGAAVAIPLTVMTIRKFSGTGTA